MLTVFLSFEIAAAVDADRRESWEVSSTGYDFTLQRSDGREVRANQWHPAGRSWMTDPHLHVNGSAMGVDLTKAHVPTGLVTLSKLVRFLIVDFGVESIREDWRDLLRKADS